MKSNIVASGGLGGEVFIWDIEAALLPVTKSVDAAEDCPSSLQIESTGVHSSLESSIDKFPYINIMEDGLVTALINDEPNNNEATALLDARTKLHCCSPLSPKLVIVVNKKKVLPHSFIEERRHQGTSKQPRRGIKARHSCKAFADYFRLSQS
ncbi:uncharacterized protein A4U43_C08F30790 [Asparagus officinalis]|nr:uncharacterized protein A4U43_C08F30790 [Asparagus officinalis]